MRWTIMGTFQFMLMERVAETEREMPELGSECFLGATTLATNLGGLLGGRRVSIHSHLYIYIKVKKYNTDNTAEIYAATRAILLAKKGGVKKLKIYSDSQFVINAITKWLPRWKEENFERAGSINKIELLDLERAMVQIEIQWQHVKAHAGNEGNENADRLARLGVNCS